MSKARLLARLIDSNGDVEIAALDNIIDSAPGTLDTLNELAAAINDDASYFSTINTSLSTKADTSSLASVATSGLYSDLSGTPTIPVDVSDLTDTGSLLTHFSGSYNDLSNKPSLLSQADAEDDATAVAIALG